VLPRQQPLRNRDGAGSLFIFRRQKVAASAQVEYTPKGLSQPCETPYGREYVLPLSELHLWELEILSV